jgi:lipopolysaccharide transport protein LptA
MPASRRAPLPLLVLGIAACAGPPGARTQKPSGEAFAEGLEVRLPHAVMRAGRASLGAAGLAALDVLVGTAHADPVNAPDASLEEVEVDADRLTLDGSGGAALLTGHVRLRRGALSLTCDRLTTRSDASGALVEARAEGSVRVQRGGLVATAAAARLDLARGEVVLDGPVRLVRAEGTVEGARVVVALSDGRVTVERARGRLRLRAAAPAEGAPR